MSFLVNCLIIKVSCVHLHVRMEMFALSMFVQIKIVKEVRSMSCHEILTRATLQMLNVSLWSQQTPNRCRICDTAKHIFVVSNDPFQIEFSLLVIP